MSENKIIQMAIEEIAEKSWGITQQFLDIHQVVYVDNKPKVDRIDRDKEGGRAVVYFPVEGEKFYFAIYLTTNKEVSIAGIDIMPYTSVCFSVSSESINLDDLTNMTILKATNTWKKGDLRHIGSTVQNRCNRFRIEPNPGPYEFKNKMELLLDILETDKKGVMELVEKAGGCIQVTMEFHNGNTMLGGPYISKEIIARLAFLKLELDFDFYVGGKYHK